jgi:hypothetical protein
MSDVSLPAEALVFASFLLKSCLLLQTYSDSNLFGPQPEILPPMDTVTETGSFIKFFESKARQFSMSFQIPGSRIWTTGVLPLEKRMMRNWNT